MKTTLTNIRFLFLFLSFLLLQSLQAQLTNKTLVVPEFKNKLVKLYYGSTTTPIAVHPEYTITTPGNPNGVAIFGDDLFVTIMDDDGDATVSPGVYKYTNYKNNKKNAARTQVVTGAPGSHFIGLVFDATGNLYVSEGSRIIKYTAPNFTQRTDLGQANNSSSYFGNLTFDGAGNLWASDYTNNRIICIKAANLSTANATYHELKTNTSGNIISANTNAPLDASAVVSLFFQPEGVAFDSDGVLWVANNNDRYTAPFNNAPTLVGISVTYQNTILSKTTTTALPTEANTINGYRVLNLPSSSNGRGQLGGMQIDKAINRIYINEQKSGFGLWFDLTGINNNITNVFANHHLNITSTNPGNGQSALFDNVTPPVTSTPAPAVTSPLSYQGLIVPEFNTKFINTYFNKYPSDVVADPAYAINLSTLGNGLATSGKPNVVTTFGSDLYVSIIEDGGKVYKFPNYTKNPSYAISNVSQITNKEKDPQKNDYVGIAFDGVGNLYTAEGPSFGNNKIIMYTAASSYATRVDLGNGGVTSYFSNIAFDAAGNLWASDYLNDRIVCIKKANLSSLNAAFQVLTTNTNGSIISANTNSTLQAKSIAKLFSNPTGVAFDKDGVLWVANSNYNASNSSPTLVALSVAYQNTILNTTSTTAEAGMANQISGYKVYSLPSSASGTGKIGGIQIDKFNNHIYISDKASQSGLVFDLSTIKDIDDDFSKYKLNIKINGGNGGISLFEKQFKWADLIFKNKIARGIILPLKYIINGSENNSGKIAENYMKLIDELAKTGVNTVEIPWYTVSYWNENLGSSQVTVETLNEFVANGHLSNIVAYCISKDITPILSINDDAISCKDNEGAATTHFNDEVMKFWTSNDVLKLIETNKSHLIIKLANKFDNVYTSSNDLATELISFQETYKNAISTLRDLGVEGPIMIDAPDCGQSLSEIASVANEMIKADPKNALIFSANIDWANGFSLEQIKQKLDDVKAADIPFVLTGISSKQNNGCGEADLSTTYPLILEVACSNNIGWMASDFVSSCSPDQQITTDGSFQNLTVFGDDIVNNKFYGLKSTDGCGTTTPIVYNTYTLIPDVAFENKLIALGIDTDGVNGKVLTKNIDMIIDLDVSNSSISDMTGISDFTALSNLNCYGNTLTSLDVSSNRNLTVLNCSYNQINTLNILDCGLLKTLETSFNQLTSLNVYNNPELNLIYCFTNQLTTLDVSKNNALVTFGCATNNLSSLNLKNGANQLIDRGTLRLENNPNLTCIQVDDKVYSDTTWEGFVLKDVQSIFQSNCSNILSVDDLAFENMSIFPNPTQGILNINDVIINQVEIYSLLGDKLGTYEFKDKALKNSIDLSELNQGTYLVYIKSDDSTVIRKIILE